MVYGNFEFVAQLGSTTAAVDENDANQTALIVDLNV